MAEQYTKSQLYEANQLLVDAEIASTELPNEELLKELNTKRATSNSFFFAMKTILKVCSLSPPFASVCNRMMAPLDGACF